MDNSQYFYRSVVFTRRNGQVALVDINHPENVTPLDDWLGIVVSLADGEHSVQALIDYLGKQYPSAPANLEETIHSVIERLVEGDIIRLSKNKVTLPYYLGAPIEELDINRARVLIQEDAANKAEQ